MPSGVLFILRGTRLEVCGHGGKTAEHMEQPHAISAERPAIWTVGHSTRTWEEFLALLTANGIGAVADVRRFAGSRRYPHFGTDALRSALAAAGIDYVHIPELGGRRHPLPGSPNTAWRNEAFRGYADHMATEEFRAGITRLLELARGRRTAILCAEAVWWRCHRALIADHLKAQGMRVLHILGAGKVEEHPYTAPARRSMGGLFDTPDD